MRKISVIIPTWNEAGNLRSLVSRIDKALSGTRITYELIFVDDYSTDKTLHVLSTLQSHYPLSIYMKKGKKGKAQSLLEGFSYAKYELLCMIDADLQYPPEAIVKMVRKIEKGADIVVAERTAAHTPIIRQITSKTFSYIFGKLIHQLDVDVQSGLKVFRKEIVERIQINPSAWTFDLEFLKKSIDAGYRIDTVSIVFNKRAYGKTKIRLLKASFEIGVNAVKLKFTPSSVIPFHPKTARKKGEGFHYRGAEFISHTKLSQAESAMQSITLKQKLLIVSLILIVIGSLMLSWHTVILFLVATISILYFLDLLFNLFLIYRSFSKTPEVKIGKYAISRLDDAFLPIYTIFCPLYKEAEVLPQFIKAMEQIDYPKDKLQVMLLLEEDDKETIAKAMAYDLPSYFEIVVVPDSQPKTKPKACNYGLQFARGHYIVIYDAEDVPEPDQLKKALIAFERLDETVVCIQAKLNFYNPYQNILTRMFTSEYSLWFDLVLTGLQSINAPIPLGGTSNHFKVKELKQIKGWDSFNVTEDCDLGIRLVKNGYRTAIIDSTTHEEANSNLFNWFNQRTRWIKGYMQTYFVHMRSPKEFLRSWKQPHVITFQLIVGGKILSMIVNPFMWIITLSYFVFHEYLGAFIESFFPAPILYIGVFSLVFGNFLYMYYYIIGCAKREHYEIIKYNLLIPFYWLAMSIAATRAVYEFATKPHYWAKTKHGLHLQKDDTDGLTDQSIGFGIGKRELAVS